MTLRLDIAWLMATLLVSARVASATALTAVLGPTQIPAPARVILVLAISALLVIAVPLPQAASTSFAALLLAVANKVRW